MSTTDESRDYQINLMSQRLSDQRYEVQPSRWSSDAVREAASKAIDALDLADDAIHEYRELKTQQSGVERAHVRAVRKALETGKKPPKATSVAALEQARADAYGTARARGEMAREAVVTFKAVDNDPAEQAALRDRLRDALRAARPEAARAVAEAQARLSEVAQIRQDAWAAWQRAGLHEPIAYAARQHQRPQPVGITEGLSRAAESVSETARPVVNGDLFLLSDDEIMKEQA